MLTAASFSHKAAASLHQCMYWTNSGAYHNYVIIINVKEHSIHGMERKGEREEIQKGNKRKDGDRRKKKERKVKRKRKRERGKEREGEGRKEYER